MDPNVNTLSNTSAVFYLHIDFTSRRDSKGVSLEFDIINKLVEAGFNGEDFVVQWAGSTPGYDKARGSNIRLRLP